jgi:hypothetical protein
MLLLTATGAAHPPPPHHAAFHFASVTSVGQAAQGLNGSSCPVSYIDNCSVLQQQLNI